MEYSKTFFFPVLNWRTVLFKSWVSSLSCEQMHKNSFPFCSWVLSHQCGQEMTQWSTRYSTFQNSYCPICTHLKTDLSKTSKSLRCSHHKGQPVFQMLQNRHITSDKDSQRVLFFIKYISEFIHCSRVLFSVLLHVFLLPQMKVPLRMII